MTHRTRLCTTLAALLVGATTVSAVDLSDNLENPTSGVETATASRWLARSFTTGASTHTLNEVTLMLAGTGEAQVRIYTGAGLEPGTLVATLTSPSKYPGTTLPVSFRTAGVDLAANATYWVVLAPVTGSFTWGWSNDNAGTGAGFTTAWDVSEDSGAFWWGHDNYPLQLSVTVDEPTCMADFDANGVLNSQDFFDFLTAFFAAEPSTDFNADGLINSQDFFDFIAAFFAGC